MTNKLLNISGVNKGSRRHPPQPEPPSSGPAGHLQVRRHQRPGQASLLPGRERPLLHHHHSSQLASSPGKMFGQLGKINCHTMFKDLNDLVILLYGSPNDIVNLI